jgi:wyosine [tRNA(Phe)-imidazoG37] synthetase (radical SAM superfamily)
MVKTNKPWNYGNLKSLKSSEVSGNTYGHGRIGNVLKGMKFDPIYGPIISRRSGLSLGINPIQGGFACNWDCNYCQYGKRAIRNGNIRFTRPKEIEQGLETKVPEILKVLNRQGKGYDKSLSLTICGPTEPTISPHFNEIVDVVTGIRDKYNKKNEIHTDLYTNCTNLIGNNLYGIDRVFMKLDAGNEKTFNRVNRPRGGLTLEEIVRQIKGANVDNKIIQTMLVEGSDGNLDNKDIKDYVERLKEIQPFEVQLYTMLYKSRDFDIYSAPEDRLSEVGEKIRKKLPQTEVTLYLDPVKEGEKWLF